MDEFKISLEDLQDYAVSLLEARKMSPSSEDMEFLDFLEVIYLSLKGGEDVTR